MLTRKQYDLLMFIHERLKETGVPPSFEEMKEAPGSEIEIRHSSPHYSP